MLDDEDEAGIFPDEITSEILSYLPAKTLFRFKCVSKRWNSIICDPQFIVSYISKSSLKWVIFDRMVRVNPDSESQFNFVMEEPLNVSAFSVNHFKLGYHFKDIFLKDHTFPVLLTNSSNWFILLSFMVTEEDTFNFYVVNPITYEWVSIPKPPYAFVSTSFVGFVTEVGPTGVLQRFVLVEFRPFDGSEYATFMCFSSETWKWEVIRTNSSLGGAMCRMWWDGHFLELDDHLAWACLPIGIVTWDEPFDREVEDSCRFIPLPAPSLGSIVSRGVDVGGGHIQCLELGIDEACLWRLQDYHGEKWDLVHNVTGRRRSPVRRLNPRGHDPGQPSPYAQQARKNKE